MGNVQKQNKLSTYIITVPAYVCCARYKLYVRQNSITYIIIVLMLTIKDTDKKCIYFVRIRQPCKILLKGALQVAGNGSNGCVIGWCVCHRDGKVGV